MPYAKGDGPSVVIALGGNALGNSPQEQLELVKNTAKHIVDMIARLSLSLYSASRLLWQTRI